MTEINNLTNNLIFILAMLLNLQSLAIYRQKDRVQQPVKESYFNFSHAIESYTALPYTDRVPRPANPNLRPANQGCNPISDIWCMHALKMTNKYIKR